MSGPNTQQCLALLALLLLATAASAEHKHPAAQKGKAQKTAAVKPKEPDAVDTAVAPVAAATAAAVAPPLCQTKYPNSCVCSVGSCSGCDACAGCEDRVCVAAPAGYSKFRIWNAHSLLTFACLQ